MAAITGIIAVIAVIATILVVTSGGGQYGLYVYDVTGSVNISNTDKGTSENAVSDTYLSTGDVITVNDGGSCTLIYRSKDNSDKNYIVLEPMSQVFVTGKFTGKSDDELYLNRGAAIVCAAEKSKQNVIIRTANSSYTTADSVIRTEYFAGDETGGAYTAASSFGGNITIMLYDSMGEAVNSGEILADGLSGKIVTTEDGPQFEYLNTPVILSDYSAFTLKEILKVSASYDLAFTSAELKEAYDNAPAEAPSEAVSDTETTSETTSAPDSADSSDTIQTAAPIETSQTTTTTVSATTAAHTTTTTPYTTTAPPQTTTAPAPTDSDSEVRMCQVYIIIDEEIEVQEVPYGGDAEQPADPVIPGKKFIGWDGSFKNIRGETTITALFEDDASTAGTTVVTTTEDPFFTTTAAGEIYHTVTIVVLDKSTTQLVLDGGAAVMPNVNVEGYTFVGWDKPTTNIKEDTVITALMLPNETTTSTESTSLTTSDNVFYTVTFVVDGVSYPVIVPAGSSVTAPVVPTTDRYGHVFVGWDKDFSYVTSDMTVTAIFM